MTTMPIEEFRDEMLAIDSAWKSYLRLASHIAPDTSSNQQHKIAARLAESDVLGKLHDAIIAIREYQNSLPLSSPHGLPPRVIDVLLGPLLTIAKCRQTEAQP